MRSGATSFADRARKSTDAAHACRIFQRASCLQPRRYSNTATQNDLSRTTAGEQRAEGAVTVSFSATSETDSSGMRESDNTAVEPLRIVVADDNVDAAMTLAALLSL